MGIFFSKKNVSDKKKVLSLQSFACGGCRSGLLW